MKKSKLTAVYLRVSTRDQSHESQSREVMAYCRTRGWARAVQVFREKASGASSTRPVLAELMTAVRSGRFERVVIYKLDRLGRSVPHLSQIVTEFQKLKVALIATSEGIDTSETSAAAEFQLNMLASVARFSREMTRERTVSGVAAARRRGVKLGRPCTLTQEKRAEILKLRRKGLPGPPSLSMKAIAARVGLSVGTVHSLLKST